MPIFAQVKPAADKQLLEFTKECAKANVEFTAPLNFVEVKDQQAHDIHFDYAMELPGDDFEVMYDVNPLKTEGHKTNGNPDSSYLSLVQARANALAGTGNYFTKPLPEHIIWHFNGTTGKSYMMNLIDAAATRHYKYGLLFVVEKDHQGSIFVLCMSNDTGPSFFRNVRRACRGIRFKP